ncbi:uncharacterized protein LOC112045301 [Bicyclus anynana]|uniref:Uncharacterized protein LOC112045301 n=1 Tax=Bicyclus anynana TaxID=110368 RepID=A0A6J1MRQ8_BICAN|nr:uncharacterized protein LOC112045301 [Bicyclus anynana]
MKALLGILVIFIPYITYNYANGSHDSRIFINTYPKKVNSPLKKSIQLHNSRKFEWLGKGQNRKKLSEKQKHYTFFPQNAVNISFDVPEISYFQADTNQKRVKKVLSENGPFLVRKKRSYVPEVNNTGNTKVARRSNNVKRTRINRKLVKSKGSKKNVRNSALRKGKGKVTSKVKIPLLQRKGKERNSKLTNTRILRKRNKRPSGNLKYAKKHKNQSKMLPGRHGLTSKKNYGRNPKQEKKSIGKNEKKVINRRLIAGRDAMIREYPYMVSIQKDHQHWCSGALLNPRLVITTANCVWKSKSASRMRVRAGSRHTDRGGQVAKIQEVAKHPKWSIRTLPDNDVALLLLDRNIKFSDFVHAVDLPNRAMWPAFEDVWVTSWGADRRDGIVQSSGVTLQVYHAMLLDHDKCNNVTMRFGVAVSRNFICVAQTGRRAPCTRDTGAPAVSDGIVWGLASWGIRKLCGTERYPAMFSYLASRSNLDFITNATSYLMSDKRFYPYGDRFVLGNEVTTSTDATTNVF